MYRPNTPWSWSFIALAFLQTCVVLAMEGYVFATFQQNLDVDTIKRLNKSDTFTADELNFTQAQTRTIPTYLTLFIFAMIFLIVLCYDALRLKNTIQVIGICIFNFALLIYAAIQMDQIHDAANALEPKDRITGERRTDIPKLQAKDIWPDIKPFLIAIPCFIAACSVVMCVICWKLYDEFAWKIYKHISADLRMKKRYLTFQIFIALLKFDFFFFVGFIIQFIVIVASTTGYVNANAGRDNEFKLTIAALPIVIIFLMGASWATRREKLYPMVGVVTVFFAALAYFLFKLVRMYQKKFEEDFKPARRSLTTFAVITILLIIFTIINAIACMMNFGKGLKPHITKRKVRDDDDKNSLELEMTDTRMANDPPLTHRMTIE